MSFLVHWVGVVCFFIHLPLAQAQVGTVTLSAGNGFGEPGTTGNPVAVSLDNQDDRVVSVQFDICRGDDLTLRACESTVRTAGIGCISNDLGNGCDRVIFVSLGGDFIEAGTGPILTLSYDVDPGAPQGTCHDLTLENVFIPECVDDGSGGCSAGAPVENVNLENGEFCFSDPTTTTVPSTTTTVPSTTTTVPSTTTTVPSTTTTIITSYTVSLSPSSAAIDSGTSLQFSAKTTLNGDEVDGTYDWEIVPGSTIGSSIDGNGLFMSGENSTGSPVEETVRVTDTIHENTTATADVTIKIKKVTPECEVALNPSSATVFSRDTLMLSASTLGDDCIPGEYEWSIDSAIGSTVDHGGSYTAGGNDTGPQVTDVVTVVDHANGDISGTASITVGSEGTGNTLSIFPSLLRGFRRMPWLHILLIRGEDAGFNLRSRISFQPGDDIVELFHFRFGDSIVAFIILRADPQEGPVEVTVSTGEDAATGGLTIALPPSRLPEDS
jgi:hypothetical protein